MEGSHHIEADESGHRATVGPGDPQAADVLEYAQLLIETEGWNQISVSGNESSSTVGWTLHDAIGEACRRLSAGTAAGGSRGSKDAVYTTTRQGQTISVGLRTDAQQAVDNELQRMADAGEWSAGTAGRIDYDYNDQARSEDDVIGVLRRAREAV